MDKAALFAAIEAEVKEVKVEALGAVLKFRVMTGTARDAFQKVFAAGDKTPSHYEASIVAATVVDDSGNPMFGPEDVETLRNKSAGALSELANISMDVNKVGAVAEADAAKN